MALSTKKYTKGIWKAYPIKDLKLNALGLCAEAGEFANLIKKSSYQVTSEEDMVGELADVMWHLAQCAKLCNSSLDELMEISLAKTIKRNNKEEL